MASALHSLDDQGFAEIMTCIYSTRLYGFGPLIKQMMHETVCKHQKGQSVHTELGPELQHHTAQRVLGGHPDMVPVFISADTHEHVEQSFDTEVEISDRRLSDLDGKPLGESLEAELEAMRSEIDQLDRPKIEVEVDDISHRSVGKLIAFLQYVAYYSALIRDLPPFTQPDVESLKRKSLENRF
jgi:glucose-6-phosphate isomerase